jgi:predicted GNAT family acetyltransferase
MALTITKKGDAKLVIQGTSVELDTAYARVELAAAANGTDMQMGMYYYADKASFKAGKQVVKIDGLTSLFNATADTAGGEKQTIDLACSKVKADLEGKGYTVALADL